ncbi:polysaccharide biosynthesis tyrosine autokinase [Nocardioides cheoyonin]|uniref:polysaccharide biosynthesis tyrosine autokinase n=1 Tax=Nocardioides cheoyonin TaxID=3156615 RepID=UPI0032B60CD9
MEITDYLKVLRRRWAWIVVTALVCAAAALALTLLQTKEYASSARLFVSTSTLDSSSELYQGGQFSQERVQSYADLASSRELAQQVISDLKLSTTPTELAGQVKAEVATNTVNLTLTVTDPEPRQAQAIAQSYAEHLSDMVRQLETPPGKHRAPIKATIVDNASYSASPVSHSPLRNAGLGLAAGLLLGFALAVLRQTLDTRINSAEDLGEVTESPILGVVSYDVEAAKTPLVSDIAGHSPRAEAFRVLRTNLQFIDVDSPQKVFVVTSAIPNEGKTSTAANLAISLAQAGVRTLLVEGDLRRPKAHRVLGLDRAVGLTDLLVGNIKLDDALQLHLPSSLDFLPSGRIPPNPAELLQSNAMAELLLELRKQYDVIIIDAPPLLPVTDGALLATSADGALLVVRHGAVARDQVRHSIERLQQVDATLVGVLLNAVPNRAARSGYGYGYGYSQDEHEQAG